MAVRSTRQHITQTLIWRSELDTAATTCVMTCFQSTQCTLRQINGTYLSLFYLYDSLRGAQAPLINVYCCQRISFTTNLLSLFTCSLVFFQGLKEGWLRFKCNGIESWSGNILKSINFFLCIILISYFSKNVLGNDNVL